MEKNFADCHSLWVAHDKMRLRDFMNFQGKGVFHRKIHISYKFYQ